MPKVSPEHLESRRRAILAAAMNCFSRQGIQNTTMQDVFVESGISPGGVYRYFPSKDQLILAIAEGVAAQLENYVQARAQDSLLSNASLEAELESLIGLLDSVEESEEHRRVAIAIWAESMRNPEVAAVISRAISRLTESIAARIAQLAGRGVLPSDTDARASAQVLVAMLPGYLLQRVWSPSLDPTQFIAAAKRLVTPTR